MRCESVPERSMEWQRNVGARLCSKRVAIYKLPYGKFRKIFLEVRKFKHRNRLVFDTFAANICYWTHYQKLQGVFEVQKLQIGGGS